VPKRLGTTNIKILIGVLIALAIVTAVYWNR